MAVESNSGLKEGTYFAEDEKNVRPFIAAGAIEMFMPVVVVAAGSGEDLPRVNKTASAADKKVIGIACGPVKASGKCADAAGDMILVACSGAFTKCVVNGTTAIAIGDGLVTIVTTGKGAKAAASGDPSIFAMALKASTVDGDIIPVEVIGCSGVTA